ncbi:aldo/keto reductase [Bacillus solimangrovi]|uniref:Glyoxal reductase n=1 Tax=Bacillus solimangrovi TaxID=1305675 RepID=A0A1E5LFI9_9BACI|nr:aldo/keto reductase [Bacillus solimangrovi]OEH92855.1 glyoxal reductase [Bacillus solimangrovi]
MPSFGLGTYKMTHSQETNDAVKVAMKHGYRLIDTASFYDNEEEIGTAIEESGMKREDIFVTTKVWNSEQGYDETIKAFERSRKKLGIEYIDLYLIHWPVPGKYIDTWKALEKLYKDGSVRAIGVCNFHIHHLQDIMENSEVVPVVNQVEYHPYLQQPELHSFCKEHNIFIEAWAPLMRGKVFDNSIIQGLSMKYNKTPAQITLRWEIQNEIITIPKSSNERRIIENANIYDFNLTEEEMKQMANLDKNERTGYDPDKFPYDKM